MDITDISLFDRRGMYDRFPPLADFIEVTGFCWNWIGHISVYGYGRVYVAGEKFQAHRLIYQILVGEIPKGLGLDHLCRNRKCVNPDHLEPVTNAVNVYRGFCLSAKNRLKTECKHGHPYDEENTYWRTFKKGRDCRTCRRGYSFLRYRANKLVLNQPNRGA